MDSGIWHKIGLELCDIDINGSIKSQGSGQRGYDLRYQPVKVGICWPLDIQGSAANVINGFVVEKYCNIGVFEQGMCGKDAVVWLNNCRRYLYS